MVKFLYGLFILSPAFILVIPHGHSLLPAVLSMVGLAFMSKPRIAKELIFNSPCASSWTLLLLSYSIFVLIGILVGIWHGNHLGYYEMFVPFFVAPFLGFMIVKLRWSPNWWFLSLGFGSLFSGVLATYQVFLDNIDRAYGAIGNPIPFGNIAVVLASICFVVALVFPFPSHVSKSARVFLIISGFGGVLASLLSGSKGGWPSLLVLFLTVIYLLYHRMTPKVWCRISSFLLFALIALFSLLPEKVVFDRLSDGIRGGWHWIQTGKVSEGSVSMRFEIWRLSKDIISERPVLGHGSVGSQNRFRDLINSGGYDAALVSLIENNPKFTTSDNEILNTLRLSGFVGLVALLAVYFGTWLTFWQWKNHADLVVRTCSLLGLLIVIQYLEFGISVSVLGTSAFRSSFVVFSVILISFITVRLNYLNMKNSCLS